MLVPNAESFDEVRADRCRSAERDLLRRDRDDERLERLRVERRPESGKHVHDPPEYGIGRRPATEGGEVERQAEEMSDLHRRILAPRLDADAAGCRGDAHLLPADHSMESPVVQDIGSVGSEVAKPRSRDREVVWRWNLEQHVRAPA